MQIQIRTLGFEMDALEEQFIRSTLACSALPSQPTLERLDASLLRRPGTDSIVECVLQAKSREGWSIRREAAGKSLTEVLFEATSRLERALAASMAEPDLDDQRPFAA